MFRLSRMQSTKDKIKQATYELLASKGYSLISMRDIAQRAGTVVGQLTYHYRTKECLMENVLDDFSKAFLEKLNEKTKNSKDKVKEIKLYFKNIYDEENDTYRILYDFIAQSLWNKKIKERVNNFLGKLTSFIENAYEDQGLSVKNATEKARELVSLILGNNILKITNVVGWFMKPQKEIFYTDELNDDFAGSDVKAKKITGRYNYAPKNIFWNVAAFVLYRLVATPIAYLYVKVKFGYKLKGRDILKKYRDQGYFIYINHTQTVADVLLPSLSTFPKKSFIIANPDNVSLPVLGDVTKMLGAIPVPGDLESSRNFMKTIKQKITNKNVVAIYPEAHVWQYYTKIRNYKATSFKYPVEMSVPTFSMTITYQKWKGRKRPRIVGYIDGPFFADDKLNVAQKKEDLRNKVYGQMCERAKNSNVEVIKYSKVVDKVYD